MVPITVVFPVAVLTALWWTQSLRQSQTPIARLARSFDIPLFTVVLQREGTFPASTYLVVGAVAAVVGVAHWSARFLESVRRQAVRSVLAERAWVANSASADPSRIVPVLIIENWKYGGTIEVEGSTHVRVGDVESAIEALRTRMPGSSETGEKLMRRFGSNPR